MARRVDSVTRKQEAKTGGCCNVEAVVTVDARGQIVLPKELRAHAGISAGDKLAVVSMMSGGKLCCLSLMKVQELAGTVREILSPMVNELAGEEKSSGQ
jgi:AbrB family looped-hinge helix DNA binding protein